MWTCSYSTVASFPFVLSYNDSVTLFHDSYLVCLDYSRQCCYCFWWCLIVLCHLHVPLGATLSDLSSASSASRAALAAASFFRAMCFLNKSILLSFCRKYLTVKSIKSNMITWFYLSNVFLKLLILLQQFLQFSFLFLLLLFIFIFTFSRIMSWVLDDKNNLKILFLTIGFYRNYLDLWHKDEGHGEIATEHIGQSHESKGCVLLISDDHGDRSGDDAEDSNIVDRHSNQPTVIDLFDLACILYYNLSNN